MHPFASLNVSLITAFHPHRPSRPTSPTQDAALRPRNALSLRHRQITRT